MSSRTLVTVLALWVLAPCALLAVFAGGGWPSPVFVPAHAYDALAAWEAFFALLIWPAFDVRGTPAQSAARLGALAALMAPLAIACAGLARTPWESVAATQGLVAAYLVGGMFVAAAASTPPRAYLVLAFLACAGLPLLGYLSAEIGGAAPAALFLVSPFRVIVEPSADAGGMSLWFAHFWGYAAAATACVLVRRRLSKSAP